MCRALSAESTERSPEGFSAIFYTLSIRFRNRYVEDWKDAGAVTLDVAVSGGLEEFSPTREGAIVYVTSFRASFRIHNTLPWGSHSKKGPLLSDARSGTTLRLDDRIYTFQV